MEHSQPGHLPEMSILLRLPFDILRCINDHLPPFTHICLTLTCTRLYGNLRPDGAPFPVTLTYREKVSLLRIMERSLPGYFLCYGCAKLCKFNPDLGAPWEHQRHAECSVAGIFAALRGNTDLLPRAEMLRTFYLLFFEPSDWHARDRDLRDARAEAGPNSMRVSFHEAHLVMRRHRYGPLYGLVPQVLDKHSETWFNLADGRQPYNLSHRVTARIIGGGLYLCASHTLTTPRCTARVLSHILAKHSFPICHHLVFRRLHTYRRGIDIIGRDGGCRVADSEDRWKSYPQFDIPWCDEDSLAVRSCPSCFTDYTVFLGGDKRARTETEVWLLRLTTYHRLGRCAMPFDPVWRCLAHRPYGWERRLPDDKKRRGLLQKGMLTARAGRVKEAWDLALGLGGGGPVEATWAVEWVAGR